jgi:hypothetical protein
MELFMVTVIGEGAFAFEFEDAFLIAEAFSEYQKVSEQVAMGGGAQNELAPLQQQSVQEASAEATAAGWTDGGTFRL